MKKVLLVTYYYPPTGDIGTFRPLTFTKYLPELGFHPYVLTVRNRSVGAVDHTLLNEIPPGVRVIETPSAEHPFLRAPRLLGIDPRWFMLPDVHIGWLPFAVPRGVETIRQEEIDVILATAPVFTSLLVGYLLKRRTGKPLVIDFRDPWTQNVFLSRLSPVHRRIEHRLERMVVEAADHVITTTEPMRAALIRKYPALRQRSDTILNGFDPVDFQGLTRSVPDRFTITYTGRLYGVRTAAPFLSAVRRVLDRRGDLRERIRVLFAGPKDKRTEKAVREMHLEDVVELVGFVSHRESLQFMTNADVLLLIMSEKEAVGGGAGTMMIPGKTFEYLGARRPILALAPEGAVAELVRDTGSGTVVAPDDVSGIADTILRLFDSWQAGTLNVKPVDVSVFDRRTSAARLATVLSRVLPPRGSSMRLHSLIAEGSPGRPGAPGS